LNGGRQLLKSEIRRSVTERLKKQPVKTRLRKSRQIENKLFRKKEFQKAKTVMFYVSLPEEVGTRQMIARALRSGKRIVVPRLVQGRIRPVQIHRVKKDLKRGRYGILEPKRKTPFNLRQIDVVVVPGVAFDRRKNRLGRGGGYYDRFLKRLHKQTTIIGLAYQLQLLPTLPVSSRDVPVRYLISA